MDDQSTPTASDDGVRATGDMFPKDGDQGVEGYHGAGPNAIPRWHGGAEEGDAVNGEYATPKESSTG